MIWPPPISAYVGVNGSGKSLSAIAVAIADQKRRGRPIITNMQGLSVEHYLIEGVEQLPDLMALVGSQPGRNGRPLGCTVVLDEAGAMFAARDTGRNKAFEKAVQQLRKYGCRLIWTAPAFGRADKILREVTFHAILCQSLWKRHEGGTVWPSTRLILQKSFDVSRLDNSGMTINRNAKAKKFGIIRTAAWEDAFDSFATAGIGSDLDGEELVRSTFRAAITAPLDDVEPDTVDA